MGLANWIGDQYGLLRSAAIYHRPGRLRRLTAFYGDLVPRGGLAFDVGAHLGNRTRAWRRLGAQVVAVEPHPDLARWLQRGFGSDDGVAVEPCAIGRAAGEITLHISRTNPTVTTTDDEWKDRVGATEGFAHVRWRRREIVPQVTLDALIARHGVPDFIKIDVEGAEAAVLGGLSTPIRALSFEIVPAARDAALACLDELDRLGRYRLRFSQGESLAWDWDEWRSADEVRRWINDLPAEAPSGDLYALRDDDAA